MKKLIKTVALLMIPTIGLALTGCSPTKVTSTGNEYVIQNNGIEYYLQGTMVIGIDKNNGLKAVGCEVNEEEKQVNIEYIDNIMPLYLSEGNSVVVNNNIYKYSYGDLYKYSFTDNNYKLDEEIIDISSNFDNEYDSRSVSDLKTDGKYIYFIINPLTDYFKATPKGNYFKMGKMSLDGKEFELFDTVASSYTISDGWIYYFNNGYTANNDNYSFDYEQAGLYKMKTDGSEREELISGKINNYKCSLFDMDNTITEIKANEDYIYFIDHSERGQGRVCRTKKDGSDYQVISDNTAYSITFDTNNHMYYSNSEDGVTNRKIYEVSLDSMGETKLFEVSLGSPYLDCYDNYLYLSCSDYSKNNEFLAGERYDIANKKVESIYCHYNEYEVQNDIFSSLKKEGPYLEWETE